MLRSHSSFQSLSHVSPSLSHKLFKHTGAAACCVLLFSESLLGGENITATKAFT